MIIPNNSKELFEKQRYVVVKQFLPIEICNIAFRYGIMKADIRHPDGRWDDIQTMGSYSAYADTLMECLLEFSIPHMEKITGLKLFPTYSYFRTYKNGDVLEKHTDRPSCEISLTLNLGQEETKSWPIYMNGVEVDLKPGDMVVYRGTELDHWRDRNLGGKHVQVFMHYVDKQGPFGAYAKFDNREMLGLPSSKRNPESMKKVWEIEEQIRQNAEHHNKKT